MEELNLMEFNSPTVQNNAPSPLVISVIDVPNVSPGNNPFDSLSKCTEILCNTEVKAANDFHTPSAPNENIFKFAAELDFERAPVACLLDVDFPGRESLGILQLEALNFSFNNDVDVPRVCTSQLNVNNLDEQKSSEFSTGPLNTAFLYPLSYCQRKQSILSSNSSISTNPSSFFNSGSLEASEPSKIYSLNSTKNYGLPTKLEDELNDAFFQTSSFEIGTHNLYANSNESRQRVFSLPALKAVEVELQESQFENTSEYERSCRSESEIALTRKLIAESHIDDVPDVDEVFNDSVFIEANEIASKIADGSILLYQSSDENLLDCTSPPAFDNLDKSENESDNEKIDAETIFKVIDKMLPEQNSIISHLNVQNTNENRAYTNNIHVSNAVHDNSISDLCKEISNNKSKNHSGKLSTSRGSTSSKCSKDANELLQDLSEIINHEYIDSKQKIAGQQLLCSLANILCSNGSNVFSNKYDTLDDSGHSSIEHDEPQNDQELNTCYDVLDLRAAASKSNENEQALDLSMTSKVDGNKRLSQSFSFSRPTFPAAKLFNALKTHSSLKSSTSSLESSKDKSNHELSKLKPKKIEGKISATKKGPLKAVIPLGDMSRRKSFTKMQSGNVTPPKLEQPNSTLFKVKRTSTPIAEPQIKPVAQSTPDDSKPNLNRSKPISCSSQLKKRKFYCPVSPLTRPSSIGDTSTSSQINKSNHSGSAPNLSNHSGIAKRDSRGESFIPSPKAMHRRHSATELKIAENTSLKLKRANSIGKDPRSCSMINKMKENVRASLSKGKSNTSLSKVLPTNKKNIVLQERNPSITSNSKSSSLFGRFKKNSAGKENISS